MLEKMLQDLIVFMLVFTVFFAMYSVGMVILLADHGAAAGPYASLSSAGIEAFLLLIDNHELGYHELHELSAVAAYAFVSYAFLVVVMLLNVLIAMMGATFARVSDDAHREYLMARARLICHVDEEKEVAAEWWLPREQVVRAEQSYDRAELDGTGGSIS
mmetsp:Transcript_4136/g.10739  ORF Transcript_4136/g.10739 Transcript_4136/m.10739 type:complete len:160 (-) Transcript_4136:43-522(-)